MKITIYTVKAKKTNKTAATFYRKWEAQKYIENHNNRYYLVEDYIIV